MTDSKFPDGKERSSQPKWRQDFPIDVPEEAYVSRRDFAKFIVLTSGAFVAGQLWIAVKALFAGRAASPPPAGVAIGPLAELPVGGVRPFRYPTANDPCLLIRTGASEVVAYSQLCTHLSCAVVPEVNKRRLACPCHHAFFDLASGRPTSGPPRRPLPRITLAVRQGVVYAMGVEHST